MLKKTDLQTKLIQMQRAAEERDAQRRAQKNNLSYLDAASSPVSVEALELIPEEIAKKAKIAAIEIKENKLALVVFDPVPIEVKNIIKKLEVGGFNSTVFVVSLSGLNHIFNFYKFVSKKTEAIVGKVEVGKSQGTDFPKISSLKELREAFQFLSPGSDIVRILDIVLLGALANAASDIHFEPEEKSVKLRIRVDGILHDVFGDFKKDFYLQLLSRIKLLSNLKINIHDESQDGRFTINLAGKKKEIEVRVATSPSEFGEVVVMRLLDPDIISLSLSDLGIREDDLEIIKNELKRPNGMILNTGPTGSGKTTTLYAFLKHNQTSEVKIITIEDPIEYHIEGIEQTQVNEEAGYTFANGLRSIMRQDPDSILVGEMRDKETAEIGIQAALTGHLVFSTLHTNNASGAIPRLLDLGVKPTSIGPALNLVIAQRLARRLCSNCKILQVVDEDLENKIKIFLNALSKRVDKEKFKEIKIFKPKGCDICNGSGYKGRVGVYEIFLNDPEYEKLLIDPSKAKLSSHKNLDELISQGAGEFAIEKFALEQGMVTMQQDGILKVIEGITTLEEVEKISGAIKW
ncbi:MAG: GspE/PulE family protein [Patescibacteria group bacterium]